METYVSLQTAALVCSILCLVHLAAGIFLGRRCRHCAKRDRMKARIPYPFLSE